ncbi:MAG: hypothetical protein WBB07_23905 [Mycobacterium sp.]
MKEASFHIYEKSGRHHHQNHLDENVADAEFSTMFISVPEHLGVRIRIADEVSRGSLIVDVAVIYKWDRPATPEDDLDTFAIETAIPQVLSCASAVLVEVADSVAAKTPFYGVGALEQVIEGFRQRSSTLSELLAKNIEKAEARSREQKRRRKKE